MEQPVAMKQQASIDHLPPEMLCAVLERLQVNELLRCRLVCTRWNQLIRSMRLRSLVVKREDRTFSQPHTSFTFQPLENKPIYFSQNEDLFEAAIFKEILKNVRELYLDLPSTFYYYKPKLLLNLNELTRLEVLEIVQIQIGFFELDQLILPNLLTLCIALSNEGILIVDCPKLLKLDVSLGLESMEFEHCDSLRYLSTERYHDEAASFVNLEYLQVKLLDFKEDGVGERSVPKNVLTIFPKLKELHTCKMASKNTVAGILASKAELSRSDFNFFYCSLKIEQLNELARYADPEDRQHLFKEENKASFQIVLDNYSKLAEIVPWIEHVNYTSLHEFFKGRIEIGPLFKRFVRIRHLIVNKPLLDQAAFVEFLRKCSCLRELCLTNTGLDQRFFDQLSSHRSNMESLVIDEPLELDLEFVFTYKHLTVLKVKQELSYALVVRLFEHFDSPTGLFHLECKSRGRRVFALFIEKVGFAALRYDDNEPETLMDITKATWFRRLKKVFS